MDDLTLSLIAIGLLLHGWNVHRLVHRSEDQAKQIGRLTRRVWQLEGCPKWTPGADHG